MTGPPGERAAPATRRRALVTGASRGCGRGCAVALAEAGFDVVLTARSAAEGEQREHALRTGSSDTSPLPGSLATTASEVVAAGGRAWTVVLDLGVPAAVASAAADAADRWGPFDAVVHAARYVGPGHGDRFLETPAHLVEAQLAVNVLGPLALLRAVLPAMASRGSGVVVNLTSGAAVAAPPSPVGAGGWSLGYGLTKGALHRAVEVLAVELEERGVRCYNLEPGSVRSERLSSVAALGVRARDPLDPHDVGRVAAWLCAGDGPEPGPPTGTHVVARAALETLG